jgi:hypothetical protein
MHGLIVVGVVGAALALGGCGSKKDGAPVEKAATAADTAKAEEVKKQQDALLQRRAQLQRERKQVEAETADLVKQREARAAEGKDTAELDKEIEERESRAAKIEEENTEIDKKADEQFAQLMAAAGADTSKREAAIALREGALARREEQMNERWAMLNAKERELNKRDREQCSAPTTTIVERVEVPRGTKYSKRDVEKSLKAARREMAEKGILSSDLSGQAQSWEKESMAAMADGDYGKAKLLADQLNSYVESVKVDRGFVSAKFSRLNAAIGKKQLTSEQKALFEGATSDIGDGKYGAANSKLNKLWASIR